MMAQGELDKLVGEGGHYLNSQIESTGGILDLVRTHRDRLKQTVKGPSRPWQ